MVRWIVRHPLLASSAPLAVFALTTGLLLAAHSARRASLLADAPPSAEVLDEPLPVGDFAFTERSGQTVTQDSLRGRVWIAACFFTCCTDSCPKLSGSLARLQHELAGEPDVRLVSLTVDPARDTPATLSRYAEVYRADADRWLFLTGSAEQVHAFVQGRLKLGVAENTGPGATPGTRVLHSPKLTLIDRRGRIRGYYDGTDPEAVARLRDAAGRLAGEAP
jgi:cytochrome oxidase Cu insertion factor (SCO1/SenC/PrrC family)